LNKSDTSNNKIKISIFIIFLGFIILTMIFTRSFIGLYLLEYRLGELLVLTGFILCIFFVIFSKKINYLNLHKIFNNYFRGIVVSFFAIIFITNSSITNTYAFKSSSYIWTIGFLFLGTIFSTFFYTQSKKIIPFLVAVPFIVYVFNTGNYPDIIINFFKIHSDKFQFIKASDVFLSIISIYFYLEKVNVQNKFKLLYVFIYGPLFLPMLLIQSRGSYVGLILFILSIIYFERNYLLNNKKTVFVYGIIGVLIFIFSTFRTSGISFFNTDITPEVVTEQVQSVNQVKDTKKAFLTFYISDGRLFSKDETTNWRLDIWQDVAYDMVTEKNIMYGYGYKSIIPQMIDPSAPGRLGRDGLNENVHNYFVTILSRGGLIQLFLFVFFHFSLINIWKLNHKNYKILIYYIPAIFVSCLDISMDGVQFPLIFYTFLGYFLANNK
jgi:hypothetical protein